MLRLHIDHGVVFWATYKFLLNRSLSSRVGTQHTLTHIHLAEVRTHSSYIGYSLSIYMCHLVLYLFGPPMIVRKFCSDGRSVAGTVTRKISGRSVTRFFLPQNTNDLVHATGNKREDHLVARRSVWATNHKNPMC